LAGGGATPWTFYDFVATAGISGPPSRHGWFFFPRSVRECSWVGRGRSVLFQPLKPDFLGVAPTPLCFSRFDSPFLTCRATEAACFLFLFLFPDWICGPLIFLRVSPKISLLPLFTRCLSLPPRSEISDLSRALFFSPGSHQAWHEVHHKAGLLPSLLKNNLDLSLDTAPFPFFCNHWQRAVRPTDGHAPSRNRIRI